MDFTDIIAPDLSYLDTPNLASDYSADTTWLNKYKGMLGDKIDGTTKSSAWNVDKIINGPTSISDFATPTVFDPKKEGLTRFQSSEYYDNLGFVAGTNNEELYGQVQTTRDILGNAFSQMWNLTKYQFKDQLAGWGRLFDFNPIGDDMEEVNAGLEEIMNKNPIFMTEANKESTFNWAKVGNVIGQAGFTLGAMGELLFEEIILSTANAFSGGALSGVQAGRTAQLLSRFAKNVTQNLRVANRVSETALDVNKLRNVYQRMAAKAADYTPLTNTLQFAAKGARQGENAAQITSRGFGAFYRDLREANAAFTEARAEAAGTYVDLKEQLIDEYRNRNGSEPTILEIEKFDKIANEGKSANFLSNALIIGASNRIQFDNLLKGFKGTAKFMGESGTILQDSKGFFKKGINFRSVKAGIKTAPLIYFKNNITEGIQESLQSISNEAVKSWYTTNYFNPETKSVLQSVKDGIKSQISQEGLDTFLAGFVTGAVAGPIQGGAMWGINRINTSKAQRQQRATNIKNNINTLNTYFTFNDKRNLAIQTGIANKMAETIKNGDKKGFYDLKDESVRSFVRTGIETNKLDTIFDQLEKSVSSLSEQEFRDAYGIDTDKRNVLSSIQEIKEKTENIKNAKEELDFKYPTDYTGNSMIMPKAYEEAKWQVAFMRNSLNRVNTRQKGLINEIQQNFELSELGYEEMLSLVNKQSRGNEIQMLKEELKLAPNPEKNKKLQLLELIESNSLSPEILKAYLKLSSKKPISEESMASAYEGLIDYAALSEDEQVLTSNLDFIADPNNFRNILREHQSIQQAKMATVEEEIKEVINTKKIEEPEVVETPVETKEVVLSEEEKSVVEQIEGQPVRKNLIDEYARRTVFEFEAPARGSAPSIKNKSIEKIQKELFTGENAPAPNGDVFRNEEEKQYYKDRKNYWVRVKANLERLEKIYNTIGENQEIEDYDQVYINDAEKLQNGDIAIAIERIYDKLRVNNIVIDSKEKESKVEAILGEELMVQPLAEEVVKEEVIEEEKTEPEIQPQPEVITKAIELQVNPLPEAVIPQPKVEVAETSSVVSFTTIRNEILNFNSLPKGFIDKDGKPLPYLDVEDYAYFTNKIIRDLFSEGALDEYQFRLFKDDPKFYEHESRIEEKDRFKQGTYKYTGERTGLVIFLMDKQGNAMFFDKKGQPTTSDKGYKLAFFLPSVRMSPAIAPIRERLEKKLVTAPYVQLELSTVTKGVLDQSTAIRPALEFFESVKSEDDSPVEDRLVAEMITTNGKKSYEALVTTGKGLSKIYLKRNKAASIKYEGLELKPLELLEFIKRKDFPIQEAKNIAQYLNEVFATNRIVTFNINSTNAVIELPSNLNTDLTYGFEKKFMGNDRFFVFYLNEGKVQKKRVSYRKFVLENSSVNNVPIKTPDGKLSSVPVNVRLEFKAELPENVDSFQQSQSSTVDNTQQNDTQSGIKTEESTTIISNRVQSVEELTEALTDKNKVTYKDRVQTLKDAGVIDDITTVDSGRPIIIVNINGQKLPFYRSRFGTSGKTKNKWFPFFGFGKHKADSEEEDWFVKGTSEELESSFDSPLIKKYSDLINSAFNWDRGWERVEMEQQPLGILKQGLTQSMLNQMLYGTPESGIIREDLSTIKKAYDIINRIKGTASQTIEELEAERDEAIRVLEQEKAEILRELEEIEKTQTLQETEPDVTEEDLPDTKEEAPTGLSFTISPRHKVKAYWSGTEGKWNFYTGKGKKITSFKQIAKYSAIFTKNASRWAETWWNQLLSPKDRNDARGFFRDLRNLIEGGVNSDSDYMNADAFVMQQIRGTLFDPKQMGRDVTDVKKSAWFKEEWIDEKGVKKKGVRVDTYVIEDLLPEMIANGFTTMDEKDVINLITELINRYPNGIRAKDIEDELGKNNPARQLIVLEEEFMDRFGFSMAETYYNLDSKTLEIFNNEELNQDEGQPETTEDTQESQETEEEVKAVEEHVSAIAGITLSVEEKEVVAEVFAENRIEDESQDEFLSRQVREEANNIPTSLKGKETTLEKFKRIIKKILTTLSIVALFYTAGNPVADFLGRNNIISREKTQFVMDLAKIPSNLTDKSFTEKEKQVIYAAIKKAESKGKNYVTYKEYSSGNQGVKQIGSTQDKDGENILGSPELTVKRTLGQFTFAKVGENYIISDKYNFNDSDSTKTFFDKIINVVSGFTDESLSTYAKIRKIATNFGSKEGKGADVKIELPIVPVSPMGGGAGPISSMMSIGLLGFFKRKRQNKETITPEDIQRLRDRIAEIDTKIEEIKNTYQSKIDATKVKEKLVTLPKETFDKVVEYLEKNGIIIEKNCK